MMRLTVIPLIGVILICVSQSASAAKDLIHIDLSNGCPPDIRDDEPRDNGRCAGVNACRKPGSHVRWEITGAPAEQFSISFSDTSLFEHWDQGQCRRTSGNSNRIQCKIRKDVPIGGEYDYVVSVGSCVFDPKIIINN